nr:hypothetical protein [Massilia glaciei]
MSEIRKNFESDWPVAGDEPQSPADPFKLEINPATGFPAFDGKLGYTNEHQRDLHAVASLGHPFLWRRQGVLRDIEAQCDARRIGFQHNLVQIDSHQRWLAIGENCIDPFRILKQICPMIHI